MSTTLTSNPRSPTYISLVNTCAQDKAPFPPASRPTTSVSPHPPRSDRFTRVAFEGVLSIIASVATARIARKGGQ